MDVEIEQRECRADGARLRETGKAVDRENPFLIVIPDNIGC